MKSIKSFLTIVVIALLVVFHANAETDFKADKLKQAQRIIGLALQGEKRYVGRASSYLADGLWGTEKNPELAFKLVEDACSDSLLPLECEVYLARYYAEGVGVAQDKMKAIKILTGLSNDKFAKLYFDFLNNKLTSLEWDQPWDSHICFCVAEKKLESFLVGDAVNINYQNPIKEILKYYCWSWARGNQEAGERFMELRFVDKQAQSDAFKKIKQSPLFNDYSDTFRMPLYSILGPGQVWSNDPLVHYARIMFTILQLEYEIDKDVAIKDMLEMINADDWAWQSLKYNKGKLREQNMTFLKFMSECGIEAASELFETELLDKGPKGKIEAQAEDLNIYRSVEQMPQFPGGADALIKYIDSHICYPPMAAKNNVQGKVILEFVVEVDGEVGEVKVVRSVDKDLDAEAVRVVKELPKFVPGLQGGKAVRVWYVLPVPFRLKKDK